MNLGCLNYRLVTGDNSIELVQDAVASDLIVFKLRQHVGRSVGAHGMGF